MGIFSRRWRQTSTDTTGMIIDDEERLSQLLKKQLAEAMRTNAELKRRLSDAFQEITKLRAEVKLMRSVSGFTEIQMGG